MFLMPAAPAAPEFLNFAARTHPAIAEARSGFRQRKATDCTASLDLQGLPL